MAWWVYKCNSRNREYQNAYGDWDQFFDDPEEHWGKSEWVPELARLKVGDYIIAYQTNRNKIVGLTRVRQSCEQDGCLYLTPLKRIGGKVRPLKKDARYRFDQSVPARTGSYHLQPHEGGGGTTS